MSSLQLQLRLLPFVFILLWSSAFVSGKFIVQEATPFAALFFRFVIVAAGYALFARWQREKLRAPAAAAAQAMGIGALLHGVYLGGVFYAIAAGMPAGLAALIVTLYPVLTAALARPLLGERVSGAQWGGIALAFAGAALTLGVDLSVALPRSAYFAVVGALLAITAGTLWQKKVSSRLPLVVNNMYQGASAALFYLAAFWLLEPAAYIDFSVKFALAMGWQIIVVSFGAYTILTYLIKHGSASKTAALFFLVPGTSVLMAWAAAGEQLSLLGIAGLLLSSLGAYAAINGGAAAGKEAEKK